MNDLLFPSAELNHDAFETRDRSVFSSGQVDVFFDKSFNQDRALAVIDGQGQLNVDAISNTLQLSNIVLIHFHFSELNDRAMVKRLQEQILSIKTYDSFIKILLLVRDAAKSSVVK